MADSQDQEIETRKCPNCRQMIPETKYAMHEARCVKYCTYCEQCEEPVPNTEYESHMTECHTPKPCPDCTQSIEPSQMEQHKEHCPEAMVQCKYCDLDVKRKIYSDHVDACGSRTEVCEMCSIRVKLSDMQEHIDLKCGHLRAEAPLDPHTLAHLPTSGVDQQWMDSVSNAMGGDVDSLLAQNINYFQNVTAPDHSSRPCQRRQMFNEMPPRSRGSFELPPSSRDFELPPRSRGSFELPPSSRDFELPPASRGGNEPPPGLSDTTGDVELAYRLQQEEMRRDQAFEVDQTLARQLQDEQSQPHTSRTLTPPSTYHELAQRDHELAQQLHEEEVQRDQGFGRDLELAKQLQQEEESQPHSSHHHTSQRHNAYGAYSYSSSSYSHTSHHHSSQPHSSHVQPTRQGQYTNSVREEALLQMRETAATYDDDDLIMLPCQFCGKMCPVQQLTLHQNSCRHGNQDVDLERDTASVPVAIVTDTRPCMYCYEEFPEDQCAVHETLCGENPELKLKNVYRQTNGQSHTSTPSIPSQPHINAASQPQTVTPSLEEIPCETCGVLVPLSALHRHQVTCSLTRKQPSHQLVSHAVPLTRRSLHPSHPTQSTNGSTRGTNTPSHSTNGPTAATGRYVRKETTRTKPQLAIRFPTSDEGLSVNGHSIASADKSTNN